MLPLVGRLIGTIRGAAVAVGTQYYVSATGSDSNDGLTTSTPWQTLTKVNGFSFSAGDTVSFKGGDTFSGTLTPSVGGSSDAPITFNSYGTGQATISAASGTDGVTVTDKSYITINNFTLTSAGGSAGVGINIVAAGGGDYYGFTVSNCNLSNFPSHGIFMSSGAGGTLNDVTITSCVVDACCYGPILRTAGIASHGSSLSARNVTIDSCIVKNNTGSTSAVGNWSGSGIYLGQCNVGLITNCQADNNGANGDGPTGIWTASSIAVIIQHCESKNTKTAGGDGGGFDMDGGCQNCITQYCYSHNNIGFGYLNFSFDTAARKNDGNIIRYNVSVNDLAGGVKVTSSALDNTNALVYGNNITLNTSNDGIRFDKSTGSMAGMVVANNIILRTAGSPAFIQNAVSPGSSATVAVVGNNYFGGSFKVVWAGVTYTSLADWQSATGQEKIGGVSVASQADPVYIGSGPAQFSNVAPQLVMDPYRLDNSSTLIGAGVNLYTNYAIDPGFDYFGAPVNSSTTNWTPGVCSNKSAVSQNIITASGTFNVPADYVNTYLVECIGAGGSVNGSSAGAGGGAYAAAPIALSANQSVTVVVGAPVSTAKGGDTVFNATSLANAQSLGPTVAVGAEGGQTNVAATGGIGGSTANSVGTIKFAGGNASQTASSRSGGGGAGSRFGTGRDGGAGSGTAGGGGGGQGGGGAGATGTTVGGRGGSSLDSLGGSQGAPNGGTGPLGGGGGGGTAVGGRGGHGGEWIVSGTSYGPGGGGGGSNGVQAATNVGGNFGGGGGGRNNALGGTGGIRFLYQTAANQ